MPNKNDSNRDERDPMDDPADLDETPDTWWSNPHEASLTPHESDMSEDKDEHRTLDDYEGGYVLMDTEADDDDWEPLDQQDQDEFITIGTDPDVVMDEIDNYSTDDDVLDEFAERQTWTQGSNNLYEDLREHNALKPGISGNDIDASWEQADQSGEEAVGGTVSTPDQDRVDDLGEAVGIQYQDDEPLNTYDKIAERDENRWELNPASTDEYEEDLELHDDEDDDDEDDDEQ